MPAPRQVPTTTAVASRNTPNARSRSAALRSARTGPAARPEVGQVPGPVGVVGRGGGHRLLASVDRPVQIRRGAGALEPGPQRVPEVGQVHGPVGVIGRGGCHRLLDRPRSLGPDPPRRRCARTGSAARSRGWTGTWAGRGGRSGWPPPPPRRRSIARSRSAAPPVRSNRLAARSRGWTGTWAGRGDRRGVAATAGLADGDRPVQIGRAARALEPGPQRDPEVGQVHGPVGVVGRGGGHRLPRRRRSPGPGRLRCPGALEPGLQRERRGWTGTWAGRGGRPGWPPPPPRTTSMARSRSAALPVRSNRVRSASPRLDRYMGRSGWSAGVAATASSKRVMARSRSAIAPLRWNRLAARSRGWTGVTARSGWSGGVAATASSTDVDRPVQVGRAARALEPGLQREPEVGQEDGPVGVVGRGGRHRRLGDGRWPGPGRPRGPVRSNRLAARAPRLDRNPGRSG